jgi:hypothetical protein
MNLGQEDGMDLIAVITVVGLLLLIGIPTRLLSQSSREARCDRQVSQMRADMRESGWRS